MSVRQWGSERRGGAYPNKHSKQAHAVEAPAPIYLQTDHLSAHTTDHCPDPTLIPKASLAGGHSLVPSHSIPHYSINRRPPYLKAPRDNLHGSLGGEGGGTRMR